MTSDDYWGGGPAEPVVLRCPVTKKWVDTGMAMDQMSYRGNNQVSGTITCPECTQTHRWSLNDTRLGFPPGS